MIRFQISLTVAACLAVTSVKADSPPEPAPRVYAFPNTVDVGEVEEANMVAAYARVRELADSGVKAMTLRIDSFGGSIFLGARWVKAVEDVKKAKGIVVACVVDGAAYSMAAVILQSPVCDLRLATLRSTFLFHNGSTRADGTAVELNQSSEFLEALNESMAWVVSRRIGLPYPAYRERIAHGDWVMAVREALTANVIDGVVDSAEIAPPGVDA